MADAVGFGDAIVGAVVDALSPLTAAAQDETALVTLVTELGWLPPQDSVPGGSMSALQAVVNAVGDAETALDAYRSGTSDDKALAALLSAAADLVQLVGAVQAQSTAGLPAPLDSSEFWTHLAQEVPGYLIARYLKREHGLLFAVFRLFGIVDIDIAQPSANRDTAAEVDVLRWDRLGTLLENPGQLIQDTYGWGGTFDYNRFVRSWREALVAAGVTCFLVEPGVELLDEYYPGITPPGDVCALHIPLYVAEGDPYAELGLDLLPVPAGGGASPAGFLVTPYAVAGGLETVQLTDVLRLTFAGTIDGTGATGIVVGPSGIKLVADPNAVTGDLGVGLDYAPPLPAVLLGGATGSGIRLAGAGLEAGVRLHGVTVDETQLRVKVTKLTLRVDFAEGDGFLAKVTAGISIEAGLDGILTWSSTRGVFFEGGGGLAVTVPLNLSAGPVELDSVTVGAVISPSGPELDAGISASLALGPVSAAIKNVGIKMVLEAAPDGEVFGLKPRFGFKLPDGVGMAIDASVVTGGGYIEHKQDEYDGILEVCVADYIQIKVIGLLNTKLPDGRPGFSLLLIITAEFQPIQLGYGFTLNGVGGLAGINRTMVTEAIRSGIRNGTVRSIMFPPDPIKHAPQLISNLRAIFPVADGRYVFGPMVMIGWGASLIKAALGVILEVPAPIRIVILGRIMIALPPAEEDAVVKVNLDVVGILEFEKKQLSIDATIYDSEIAGLALSGDMAMRLDWGGQPNFALSMGGLHPDYRPPPNFPKLQRLALQFGSGDNPRLAAEAYLAITADSFQVGAHIGLHAEAGGCAVDGGLGFDTLFIFVPQFSMAATMSAGVQLLTGKTVLMVVKLDFKLTGPHPWHAQGQAVAHLLFFNISVPFDKTWGDPSAITVETVDAKKPVLDAIGDARNWSASLPDGEEKAVTLGDMAPSAGAVLVHPMGRLTVRQKVAPLDYTMSLFGNAPASGANRFTIGQSSLGTGQLDPVSDQFAAGQFTKLTDDEKLTRPSYEPFHSGASIGSDETTAGHVSSLDVRFETALIDEHKALQTLPLYALATEMVALASQSAAGVSKVMKSGSRKFAEPGTASAVSVNAVRHVIASTDDLSVVTGLTDASGVSAAAATELLARHLADHPEDADMLQVIPAYEAAA